MRVKLLVTGLVLAVSASIAIASAPRTARTTSLESKGAGANAVMPAAGNPVPSQTAAAKGSDTKPTATANKSTKPAHRKRAAARGSSLPSGAGNCVAELEKLSAKDPLPEYQHGAFQIINDGLLWDSAQSKCSVGSDQGLRAKVSDLATAWQEGDAAKVRSLVADIKGSVPAATPSAPKVHHHSKKPAAKTEKPGNA